jgi:hypothetical protein
MLWQARDLSILSLANATATATASTPGTTSSSQPESAGAQTLSPGAQAGIGVGVALAVTILIGSLWVLLWRRHKRKRLATAQKQEESLESSSKDSAPPAAAELPNNRNEAQVPGAAAELDPSHLRHKVVGQRDPGEVDGVAKTRAELGTEWRGWEVSTAPGRRESE